MNIGLTYDLRQDYLDMGYSEEETAEFDKESTVEGIEKALRALGYKTERIGHIKNLVKALAADKSWDLVFNITEGLFGLAREAQVPALLDAYEIPYVFSDAFTLAVTLDKGLTKSIVRNLEIPTADYFVLKSMDEVEQINLPYPLFAKPIAEGTGKGINANSKITDSEQLKKVCENLLKEYKQPVLIETFLSGDEFTVGITGTGTDAKVVAVMEILLGEKAEAEIYSYSNKDNYEDRVSYKLASDENAKKCEGVALAVWKGLGCRDGGRVDVRMDSNGVVNFIEVNPLAGLNYKTSDLPIMCGLKEIEYNELIRQIMDSALQRIKK
jgi:D-alanine-D-alanine ligase